MDIQKGLLRLGKIELGRLHGAIPVGAFGRPASVAQALDVIVPDSPLQVGKGFRPFGVLPLEYFTRGYGKLQQVQKRVQMVLNDTPEGDQFLVEIVDDLHLGWFLGKQHPRPTGEGFTVTDVLWNVVKDFRGKAGFSAKII